MARPGDASCGEVCRIESSRDLALTSLTATGKEVSPREERIRGGLKYAWKHGVSGTSTLSTTLAVP